MHQPGTNIRNLRKQLNLTQAQLASAAEIDQGSLSNIERGRGGYSKEGIERIARALNVSVGVLFADGMTVDAASLGARRVPLIEEKQVAAWRGLEEAEFDWDAQTFLFTGLGNASRFAFALRIKGRDNEPDLVPGDDGIFDIGVQPWPGAIVIATGENGDVLVGRFRQLPDLPDGARAFEVVPVNSFHAPVSSQRRPLTLRGVLTEVRKYPYRR